MLNSKRLDQIAIVLSAVCVVHCLAVPLGLAVLPVVAALFGAETHFHSVILWVAIPTSLIAFWLGLRVHHKLGVVLLGLAGLAGITASGLLGHDTWPVAIETAASVGSSAVLAIAHLLNYRAVRQGHEHD